VLPALDSGLASEYRVPVLPPVSRLPATDRAHRQVDVIDRHPETVVILAGINDVARTVLWASPAGAA
jgi:lysophospholipase L1-like esterase